MVRLKLLINREKSKGSSLIVPINVVLSLKEGSNSITVVARENDNLVARHTMSIFRTKSSVAKSGVDKAADKQAR